MRNRKDIVKDLALFHGDPETLERELSRYSWDIEEPLFTINTDDFVSVLKRSLKGEIDFEALSGWANAIEFRDDLEPVDEKMKEIIFELANPEINGGITKERLNKIISEMDGH